MKKKFVLGIALMVMAMVSVYAQQRGMTTRAITGGFEITGWTGTGTQIVMNDGYASGEGPIISIGPRAFENRNLTHVALVDGIVNVAEFAFLRNPITDIEIGANATLTSTSFPNDFHNFYNSNGKKKGHYFFENGKWDVVR